MDKFQEIESSQRQWNETLQHQEKMNLIVEQEEYNLFQMLRPKLYQDGNQWCVLYGDNIQVGIAGFGETPYKAVMDWNSKWHKSLEPTKSRQQ